MSDLLIDIQSQIDGQIGNFEATNLVDLQP